jgi:hypothetical protein
MRPRGDAHTLADAEAGRPVLYEQSEAFGSVQRNEEGCVMCGRFARYASGEELRERYPFVEIPAVEPRYNIAPTQPVAAVRSTATGRELAFLRWGLIPICQP